MTVTPVEGVRYWFDSDAQAFVAPGRPSLPITTTPVTPPVTTTFSHPGVLYTQAQLDFVKGRLVAGADPWRTAYSNMITRKANSGNGAAPSDGVLFSDLGWTPRPHAVIARGAYNEGGTDDDDLQNDIHAALTHALMWVYKGSRSSALKAVEILNAWSATLTEIKYNETQYADGKLFCGWTGTVWARTAELMRYCYTPAVNEPALDLTNIFRVFNEVYWPVLSPGWPGPGFNRDTSACDTMIQLAVFMDDRAKFDYAIAYARQIFPGLAYKTGDNNPLPWAHPTGGTFTYSDGSVLQCPTGLPFVEQGAVVGKVLYPGGPTATETSVYNRSSINVESWLTSVWQKPLRLPNGLWGETGRDFHHTGMGFAGLGNFLETAWIQGVDMYAEFEDRFLPSIELTTGFLNEVDWANDTHPADWPFAKAIRTGSNQTATQRATFEILLHHYSFRRGRSMPNTTAYMNNYARPSTYDIELMACYETLTHYGVPVETPVTPPATSNPRDSLVYGSYEPDETTTGVLPGTTLTDYNAVTTDKVTIPDGAVITNKIIYGDVTCAGSAKISNCLLVGGSQKITSGNTAVLNGNNTRTGVAVLTDCTIKPRTESNGRDCVLGKQYELYRCELSGGVDGIGTYSTSASAPNVNVKVMGCYVHDLTYVYPDTITTSHTDGTHNDCVQFQGGKNAVYRGNAFYGTTHPLDGTGANPDKPDLINQGYVNGGCFTIQNNTGAGIDASVVVEKNWFYGALSHVNIKPGIAFAYHGNRHYRATYTHGSPGTWAGYWIRFDDHTTTVDGLTTGTNDNTWVDGPYAGTAMAEPRDHGIHYNA